MSLADLPEAFLETILHQIALLLLQGAHGDMEAARNAAAAILNAYRPQTEAELRLAARIVSFNLQALEALAQAADPETSLTRVLRLRTGAVSLSREAEKAERRLEQLRKARQQSITEDTEPLPEPASPPIERPAAQIEDNRKVAAYAQANGLTWTQALKQRRREQWLAERRGKQAKAA
jgi:hypothetical protein